MPKIILKNLFNTKVEVTDTSKPLLYHFHQHPMDWMHACGGKGRCTTCKVSVLEGAENFEPLTIAEQRYARQGALATDERLACQACIKGDVLLAVPVSSKLPHVIYSD